MNKDFTKLLNLAAAKLGAKAVYATDDFFAEKENLLKPGRGIFIPEKYTDHGKWMDGWESRRKRVSGHDWCVIKLATAGQIQGLDIDTNHFLGNHPPFASVEACYVENDNPAYVPDKDVEWTEILAKSPLDPGSQHLFEINNNGTWTHLRLHIFPDGGVARFKVYGTIQKEFEEGTVIDLAAAFNGAKSIQCNDMFFSHMDNLIMPGRGVNMGDGWETKRNRTPGNRDWVIVRLATKGIPEMIIVDTAHFKGNYPDSCFIEGACLAENQQESDLWENSTLWEPLLPQSKLQADHEHLFSNINRDKEAYTHVRLTILPDGGVSRMRVYGPPSK